MKISKELLSEAYYERAHEIAWYSAKEKNYIGDKHEDAKRANRYYLKALELNPRYLDALNGYAQNLRCNLKDYDKAIEVYSKLIALNPKYPCAISRRGICKTALGNHKGALGDFNKSITVFGDKMNRDNFISRSIIKEKLKDFKGVVNDLNEAIILDGIDAFNYKRLGNAYVKLGNLEKSFDCFDKAIELELKKTVRFRKKATSPLLLRVFQAYTYTLIQAGDFAKATEILNEMQLHYPERYEPRVLAGLLASKEILKDKYLNGKMTNRTVIGWTIFIFAIAYEDLWSPIHKFNIIENNSAHTAITILINVFFMFVIPVFLSKFINGKLEKHYLIDYYARYDYSNNKSLVAEVKPEFNLRKSIKVRNILLIICAALFFLRAFINYHFELGYKENFLIIIFGVLCCVLIYRNKPENFV